MNDMKDFIEHEVCPIVDGIVYSNGEIQLLNVVADYDSWPSISYKIELGEKTSIKELDDNQKLFWSTCCIMTRCIDNSEQIEIVAGEASYGSEGFVSVISKKTKLLIWIAFFTCSNPFSELAIEKQTILATSTHRATWVFPIEEPEKVFVKPMREK